MEQRNQFPVLSTTAVLRVGNFVVVDWQALWIGGAAVVVLDSVSQFAVRRSRACGDRREIHYDHFTNTSSRADRADCGDFVRRNPDRHLDASDKISFWRSHRIDSENWFTRLDAKAVQRLVAASHFHAA